MTFPRRIQILTCSLVVTLILCSCVLAQNRVGTVQGTIKDPNGALVSGATVTITQSVTGYHQTAQTNSDGSFKLVNVPFNTYKVRAEFSGFQPTEESIDLESTVPENWRSLCQSVRLRKR